MKKRLKDVFSVLKFVYSYIFQHFKEFIKCFLNKYFYCEG